MSQPATNLGGAPLGNQHAVKGKRWQKALERALSRAAKGDIDCGLDAIADKVIALASEGEQWAVREVADRFDGKVPAGVELTGANGGEIVVRDAATAMGVARRVAFVLAQGALAKANAKAIETEKV